MGVLPVVNECRCRSDARRFGTAIRRGVGPVRPPRRFEFRPHFWIRCANRRSAVALTQTQLVNEIADRAELSKAEARRALAALDEVVLEQIGNAQKVRIGGLVQLTPRVKPAQ